MTKALLLVTANKYQRYKSADCPLALHKLMLARLNQLRIGLPFFSRTKVDPSAFRSQMSTATGKPEVATFASGCFWGVEHIFLKHYPPAQNKGILKTSVGYTGGTIPNPSYQAVCNADTGYAEAVRIEFDPNIVKYEELVEFFFRTHDPTLPNRQGNDIGSQYRSAIFVNSAAQRETAQSVKAAMAVHIPDYEKKQAELSQRGMISISQTELKKKEEGTKIVTEIVDAGEWYDAEDYHQLYLIKNPYGYECPAHTFYW
ncbi:hypothetical protein PILCRDRAFT_485568 [Piloderma croceum F 1598]|uniref:peptide-methionine (S)-S-oxide reductase n=1 Tax=Piloderma croceum (strain F 1598) TaxID=765440 RepID=A0A0C3BXR1_PILCF|nr:hypothetical protein PILCRDRAFT_485568 [Piloderma croceum F 1598]